MRWKKKPHGYEKYIYFFFNFYSWDYHFADMGSHWTPSSFCLDSQQGGSTKMTGIFHFTFYFKDLTDLGGEE